MRGFGIGLAVVLAGLAPAAAAGEIERACLASPRSGGDRALCSCIQRAADLALSPADQRKAARFFRDPDRAQGAKARDDAAAEAFWARYAAFGAAAEGFCAPGDG